MTRRHSTSAASQSIDPVLLGVFAAVVGYAVYRILKPAGTAVSPAGIGFLGYGPSARMIANSLVPFPQYDPQGQAFFSLHPPQSTYAPMATGSPVGTAAPMVEPAVASGPDLSDSSSPRFGSPASNPTVPVAPRAGSPDHQETYLEFFNRCPTADEIQGIFNDFDIEFQPGSGAETYVINRKLVHYPQGCYIDGATGLSTLVFVVKMFQLLKWFQFSDPLPVINTKIPYDWVKNVTFLFQRGVKYRIFRNSPALTVTSLFNVDFSLPSQVDEFSLLMFASLILHETRHSVPGGAKIHTCNSSVTQHAFDSGVPNPYGVWRDDAFLADGACAFDYWFFVWMRHRTSSVIWTPVFLDYLDVYIRDQWSHAFCDHLCTGSDPASIPPPPLDPSLVCSGEEKVSSAGDALFARSTPAPVLAPPVSRNASEPLYGVPLVSWPRPAWFFDPVAQQQIAARAGVSWRSIEKILTVI